MPPAQNPHQTNFPSVHCHLVNLLGVGVIPHTAVVLVNIAIHPKMHLVTEDNFLTNWGPLSDILKPSWLTNSVVYGHSLQAPGSIGLRMGVASSPAAKFSKLKSAKGTVC